MNIETVAYENLHLCNVHNLWTDKQPIDYNEKLERSNTKNWINFFHSQYPIIVLPIEQWMIDAQKIANHTGEFSQMYIDDAQTFIDRYLSTLTFDTPKFFRSENVRFKTGKHGIGPYANAMELIQTICTCKNNHSPLNGKTTNDNLTIYVLPWKNIEWDKEFRVFVKDSNIIAISPQHLYKIWPTNNVSRIDEYVQRILEYFEKIKHYSCFPDSYSMDIALIEDDVYFIEMNGYGAEYSTGSGLFHWTRDEFLSNSVHAIYFRYTVE